MNWKCRRGSSRCLIKVLVRHLYGGTEESHESQSRQSVCWPRLEQSSSQISSDKPARLGKVKCLCEAGTSSVAYIMTRIRIIIRKVRGQPAGSEAGTQSYAGAQAYAQLLFIQQVERHENKFWYARDRQEDRT
jgi:hypothetical protein